MKNQILEMSLIPAPGEIMLYVSLHDVENMTPYEVLRLAENLGFSPQLRCKTWEHEGNQEYGIYALLHYDRRDYDSALESDYVTDKAFESLSKQIEPDTAIHFTYRLKQGRVIPSEVAA